jgi:uncharacterized protein YukE
MRNHSTMNTLDQLREQIEVLDRYAAKFEDQCERAEAMVKDCQQTIARLEGENLRLRGDCDEMRAVARNFEQQADGYWGQLCAIKRERDALQEKANTEAAEARAKLERAAERYFKGSMAAARTELKRALA